MQSGENGRMGRREGEVRNGLWSLETILWQHKADRVQSLKEDNNKFRTKHTTQISCTSEQKSRQAGRPIHVSIFTAEGGEVLLDLIATAGGSQG